MHYKLLILSLFYSIFYPYKTVFISFFFFFLFCLCSANIIMHILRNAIAIKKTINGLRDFLYENYYSRMNLQKKTVTIQ